jgi:hypothetical protein
LGFAKKMADTTIPLDEPGSGWTAKPNRCSCCFPDIPSASLEPLPPCLVHQLSEHFSDPNVVINEYAFLHPDLMNGELILRPEPTKLAISSTISKEMFKQAKMMLINGTAADKMNATRAMLLISGDCYTAWNVRKASLQELYAVEDYNNMSRMLRAELELVSLVFSFRAKSTNAWAHRR